MAAYFDLMNQIYMTGDLEEIARLLQTLDPNMVGVDVERDIQDALPEDTEDEFGVLAYLLEGGTLLSLAIGGRAHSLLDIVRLLLRYGARADHPMNRYEAVTSGDVDVLECLWQHGAVFTHEDVVCAFRSCSPVVVEWFWRRTDVRFSRAVDRDTLLSILDDRRAEDAETAEVLDHWYQLFTTRQGRSLKNHH